jgi:signal transduction histidine kinase
MSPVSIAEMPVGESVELARRLHDTVAQRLAGLSYLLATAPERNEALDRCRVEVDAALGELREALTCVGSCAGRDVRAETLVELRKLRGRFPAAELDIPVEEVLQSGPRSLVGTFLVEALRNIRKHAVPTRVSVDVLHEPEVTSVTIVNDGVRAQRGSSCGAGRRLLEIEASLHGGLVESTPVEAGRWCQRLILPAALPRAA